MALLNSVLGVSWESDAQVRFRLGWLENLGLVVHKGGVWTLTADRSQSAGVPCVTETEFTPA